MKRAEEELINAFSKQVYLLKEHCDKLQKGDNNFYSEVANKLRLLLIDSPTKKGNRALLLNLPKVYENIIEKEKKEIIDFLNTPVFITPIPLGSELPRENYILYKEMIKICAEQDGGSHEDTKQNKEYLALRGKLKNDFFYELTIDGEDPVISKMIRVGNFVCEKGEIMLKKIEAEKINKNKTSTPK